MLWRSPSGEERLHPALVSLYHSLSLSLGWKWNSWCGWRDLEQTPRRLRLVALGRSALWSRKLYGEPVVKYCPRC